MRIFLRHCIPFVLLHAYGRAHNISDATIALINSRLIYVFEDGGCRSVEGLTSEANPDPSDPKHRRIMLDELKRRLSSVKPQKHAMHGQTLRNPESFSEFISRFFSNKDSTHRSLDQVPLKSQYLPSVDMEIAHVPDGFDLTQMEILSQNLPCVKYVARDEVKLVETSVPYAPSARVYKEAAKLPSDPYFFDQWALQPRSSSPNGINVYDVWKTWKGSSDTTIAIIDSGCAVDHPDLAGQFWTNPGEKNCTDGIDDDKNGFIDDCYGWDFVEENGRPYPRGTSHGTAASGIIAARSNNGLGMSGICWNCRLMCLRFISSSEGTVLNEVRAIDYAVRMGAKISNNSYGGYAKQGSRVEIDAIERASRAGHLFISSAGNNNAATDDANYFHTPSGYNLPNIISVGASTESGRKTTFSNFGEKSVHIFAPGQEILSTGRDGYTMNQGTSFAAPHVAGVAGLIWSKFPQLTARQMRAILLESCRRAPMFSGISATCGGILDAQMAYNLASETVPSTKTILEAPISKQVLRPARPFQRIFF